MRAGALTRAVRSDRLAAITVEGARSAEALARMRGRPGEPLFLADWLEVVMIHLEVPVDPLQAVTPFELDRCKGRAWVTLVAFSLRGLRPRWGGAISRWLTKPWGSHGLLNLRTYVRHGGESGIYFLAEWLDNRLAAPLGPMWFGLPYRLGRLRFAHHAPLDCGARRTAAGGSDEIPEPAVCGRVESPDGGASLEYSGVVREAWDCRECTAGSLDEWLMERYTAFTCRRGRRRRFRVWHEPWLQSPVDLRLRDDGLLGKEWPFLEASQLRCAHWSAGAPGVWMGWPSSLPFRPGSALKRLATSNAA